MKVKLPAFMRITSIAILSLIAAMLLTVIGYVVYVAAQYYRIEDNLELAADNNRAQTLYTNSKYDIISYNLGFGAYSPEYSFFMDTGIMKDGTTVVGTYAKGMSMADVNKNITGQIAVTKEANVDFALLQEVDITADRSYDIDMYTRFKSELPNYSYVYAENFHTAMLYYPFDDPIGKTNSGILTLSKYNIESAVRRSFPVTTAFIDKLFDLDRCFSVQYMPVVNNRYLTLINLHMSAYDEGGTIRAKQLKMLNTILAEERAKGNYVIAGGDFNHCLIADAFENADDALACFDSDQLTPDWIKNSVLRGSELAEGFKIVANTNAPTCRGADMPYKRGVNYSTVIDGFIVSDNITVTAEYTMDTDFAYSDHNPVYMAFKLDA